MRAPDGGDEIGSAASRALSVLQCAGVPFVVHQYEHDSRRHSFGDETVEKLGVEVRRVFKTLMVRCVTDEYVVAIVPVNMRLSMKNIARAAGVRGADMAEAAVAQRRTGYVVGGISPLGQIRSHRSFIDESAFDYQAIVVSGGKRGLSVELSPWDLLELLDADVAALGTT
ncbi:Cys-tRNA(Pro) deacylase [Schaalia suimastitidis]|uniref:Cys-tRNA(Pro) deacylase n=1 Tax=Schaalia suimastitidis TaxID=121163 RepID=UPI00068647D5|nr:Cys-tRNA(Pro) deacylase [Schaalia suimastitidis]